MTCHLAPCCAAAAPIICIDAAAMLNNFKALARSPAKVHILNLYMESIFLQPVTLVLNQFTYQLYAPRRCVPKLIGTFASARMCSRFTVWRAPHSWLQLWSLAYADRDLCLCSSSKRCATHAAVVALCYCA